jgi:hypothetical protein
MFTYYSFYEKVEAKFPTDIALLFLHKLLEENGSVIARSVSGLPLRRSGFDPRSDHVGFVAKVAMGWAVSEYFGFSYQFSFRKLLHIM